MGNNSLSFLLVEDSADHTLLLKYSLEKARISKRIDAVSDGEQALQFLRKLPPFEDAETPDIVILDLNMPKMSGLEVLQIVKDDQDLMHIPIVIMTTSEAESDKLQAYRLHANSYLVKPFDFKEFQKMIADLGVYWGIWNVPV